MGITEHLTSFNEDKLSFYSKQQPQTIKDLEEMTIFVANYNRNNFKGMAHICENCKFRAHYDKKPDSALGRFWRWHINFCPGWRSYFSRQSEAKKAELRTKYNFKKY